VWSRNRDGVDRSKAGHNAEHVQSGLSKASKLKDPLSSPWQATKIIVMSYLVPLLFSSLPKSYLHSEDFFVVQLATFAMDLKYQSFQNYFPNLVVSNKFWVEQSWFRTDREATDYHCKQWWKIPPDRLYRHSPIYYSDVQLVTQKTQNSCNTFYLASVSFSFWSQPSARPVSSCRRQAVNCYPLTHWYKGMDKQCPISREYGLIRCWHHK